MFFYYTMFSFGASRDLLVGHVTWKRCCPGSRFLAQLPCDRVARYGVFAEKQEFEM